MADTFHFENGDKIQWTGRDGRDLTANLDKVRTNKGKPLSQRAKKNAKQNASKGKRTTPPDASTKQALTEQRIAQISQLQKGQVTNATTGEIVQPSETISESRSCVPMTKANYQAIRQNFAKAILWRMATRSTYFPKTPEILKVELGSMSPFEWATEFPNWAKVYDYYSSFKGTKESTVVPPCEINLYPKKSKSHAKKTVDMNSLSAEKHNALRQLQGQMARAMVFKQKMPPIPKNLKKDFKGINLKEWFKESPNYKKLIENQLAKLRQKLLEHLE